MGYARRPAAGRTPWRDYSPPVMDNAGDKQVLSEAALGWHPLPGWDVKGFLWGCRMPRTGAAACVAMPGLLGLGFISPGHGGARCFVWESHRRIVNGGDLVLLGGESSNPF